MTKYFKKIYKDRLECPVACGIWHEGDAVNYNEPTDGSYIVEDIDETEYNTIKADVTEYYVNKEKQARILELKEKIYVREQINEDKTELQTELDELEA